MVADNIIKTPDMGEVEAIDFVNKFGYSLNKLREALGITRPQPMKQGNKIQLWKFNVDGPKDSDGKDIDPASIGEGEDIPLTHVSRVKDRLIEVAFKKWRKAVTLEEVQRVGYDMAVNQSDKQVLLSIQKSVRKDFFDNLATAPTDLGEVSGLQEAFGKSWGKLGNIFDDEDAGTIVFINPEDAGDYLGTAVIQNGQSVGFGMTLLEGFTNVTPVINNSVPKGSFYATVKDNLNLQYIDVHGESSKLFANKQVISDELGLIGLVRDDNTSNLTNQSTVFGGITLFAEVTDGVIKGTLAKKA
ncbi:hypothetical protein [Pediococcus acidilactici]|uniref:hypothetical protein n=1 Tax=Pediococcus acidilactici TaxID=1254 RepID=UPI00132F72A6|nr:hypothetical protein [Pediococcus acidilactici]KAF0500078.1 hypothetical protein GBP19_04040 [Pediococcus acidilactici]MBS9399997.1 hypothetical protein [Pediococcus acidilactici]MCH9267539.1 hypothetical protein [Pediococcus acidilactici]MCK2074537.1 hypothetical protein [Pediococcus acidilactici]